MAFNKVIHPPNLKDNYYSGFKTGFKIEEFLPYNIFPDIDEYLKYDEVLFMEDYQRGDPEFCYWRREYFDPQTVTNQIIERELRRILRTGVYMCLKEEIVWIPPNYYLFLQYGNVAGGVPKFRLKRLKQLYFKLQVRNNPFAIGTYTIKNRQDGETTMAMNDVLWEIADGNMDFGQIGMQSKDRDTVKRSCWRTFIMMWNGYPRWLKQAIYSDFASGDALAETFKLIRPSTDYDKGRDILVLYGPSVYNAFDSLNNMRRCILDEINKWMECHFYDAFLNYKKFMAPGNTRKGLFDIFSSPSDKNGWWNDEALQFYRESDIANLTENGTTKSRVHRYVSNPLDGIEGMYDLYGDADPLAIENWIMQERRNTPEDKLLGEVRGYPLNEEEMFGSYDGGSWLDNIQGIKKRKIYLMGKMYKNPQTKEPVAVYGNLERENGDMDGDVYFRQANINHFDLEKARWKFSHLPSQRDKVPLRDIFTPPSYVENSLGVDPFNLRYDGKNVRKASNGAMVNWKFRDIWGSGIVKCPTMTYLARPHHQNIFFEDALKTAIFNRAMLQYENRSDKLANYAEDRGYSKWLLPEIGAKTQRQKEQRKGDAPSGRGSFLLEGMGLINSVTNLPLDENDPYLLELNYHLELLEDITDRFDPKDTHLADLSMAWIQALVGAIKIMKRNIAKPSELNDAAFLFMLG